jgi:hypothetical protein
VVDTLPPVSGARIAIDGTDKIRMRVASALLADHRVDQVGLIGRTPPAVWGDRAVAIDAADGWDVVVGLSQPGSTEVTVAEGGGVSWAGPSGLARCLGIRAGGDARLAGTVKGDPIDGSARFAFPPPLGWLGGEPVDGIHHCPVQGSLAAVMAVSEDGWSLVVLDEKDFLDAALLAAGVILAAEGHRGPVWEDADRYLDVIEDFGLVLADASA